MMLVDCQTCPVRDVHCADCMVTALSTMTATTAPTAHIALTEMTLRSAPSGPHAERGDVVTAPLDRAERRAVSAFLAAGLVSTATANTVRAELDPVETGGAHHRARRAV